MKQVDVLVMISVSDAATTYSNDISKWWRHHHTHPKKTRENKLYIIAKEPDIFG